MSVTAGVSDTIIAIREKLRGKRQMKVKRYWPENAPEWADEPEEDTDLRTSSSRRQTLEQAFPSNDDISLSRASDDPRLRRLAVNRAENKEEVRAVHRRIRQAEIISTIEEENRVEEAALEEEGEDALEERRRRISEKLLAKRQEEERELEAIEEEDEEKDEASASASEVSEYQTDNEEDDDEMNRRAMAKPIFVPKLERETIAERERLEAEEKALEAAVRKRLEERKAETKMIVVEKIREAEEIMRNAEAAVDVVDVDMDDEVNEAEEYERWKAREISRIKPDREDREAIVKEREEIERVRNMTKEERREWERKNPKTTMVATTKQK